MKPRVLLLWCFLLSAVLLAGCSAFRVQFGLDVPAFGKAQWNSEGATGPVSFTVTNR